MDQVTFRSDTVLSDVHVLLPNIHHLMARLNGVGQPVFVSKFRILRQDEVQDVQASEETTLCSLLDEDGDLDVVRKASHSESDREKIHPVILSQAGEKVEEEEEEEEWSKDTITIEHTMATPLEDVGKQIWRGAFLLSDFILSNPSVFEDATVLELGAGTGLASIVMATVAKTVYCTDVGEDLLSMCQRNVSLNRDFNESAVDCVVKVRCLDWTSHDFLSDTEAEFGWREEEVGDLHDNTTIVIAADVCYDDDLTDALFRTLYRITSNLRNPSTVFFSIEKRLNFTLRRMDVSCEAYDHFRLCLQQLEDMNDGKMKFTVEPVPCTFPQFLQYERVEQLELWKVTASAL
ncbi:methyltransferase-like protein 22 isoform X2 [Hoplias malabaricus]